MAASNLELTKFPKNWILHILMSIIPAIIDAFFTKCHYDGHRGQTFKNSVLVVLITRNIFSVAPL
jgi:hypothetical protein